MKEYDCCFEEDNKRFRYRATAIIIEDNCVLLAKNEIDNYYYSVGGGVHIGETSEEAVKREVLEETGIRYEVDRLAIIHENFFEYNNSKKCHEIAFYYIMQSKGSKELNSNSYTKGIKETMHWLPIDKLEKYKVYPAFFKDKLTNLNKNVEHIITIEK